MVSDLDASLQVRACLTKHGEISTCLLMSKRTPMRCLPTMQECRRFPLMLSCHQPCWPTEDDSVTSGAPAKAIVCRSRRGNAGPVSRKVLPMVNNTTEHAVYTMGDSACVLNSDMTFLRDHCQGRPKCCRDLKPIRTRFWFKGFHMTIEPCLPSGAWQNLSRVHSDGMLTPTAEDAVNFHE